MNSEAEYPVPRFAVIVSSDAIGILPLKVIVPLTDWKDRFSIAHWMVQVQPSAQIGLDKPSAADTFQVRSVAQERFVRRLGQLEEKQMGEIAQALALVLEIPRP